MKPEHLTTTQREAIASLPIHARLLLAKAMAKPGTNVRLAFRRTLKTRKEFRHFTVEKRSLMVCSMGKDYSKTQAVIEARENGELPSTPHPLPFGDWAIFPFLISHKGEFYLRFYPATLPQHRKTFTRYLCNGKEISKQEAQRICLASEFSSGEFFTFSLKVKNVRCGITFVP